MRFPFAVSAAAVVAIAIAACSGAQSPTFIAPPSGGPAPTGALALTGAGQTQSAGTAGGVTGILTYVGGQGVVTATSSASAPAGTTTVSPVDRVRVEASSSPTSPNVYYVTISSTAGASLVGTPGVELSLPAAAIGSYQEAQFSGGTWTNINAAAGVTGTGATTVSFGPINKAVTIPAGGSIFLAFYQGTFPQPTPVPTNIIADSNFESGTVAPYPAAANSTGWTQCAVTAAAASAGPIVHPFSTFTPTPGATPGATISTTGTAIPQGTFRPPTPSQTSVVVFDGTHAAVLGGLFESTFRQADLSYNGLCQSIKMPANASITMEILGSGNEPATSVDYDVNILDTTGKYLANVYDEQVVTSSNGGDTAYRNVTVPTAALSPFAGQNVEIFIGIWTKAGGSGTNSGYYFVDDFQLVGLP
jgi:hypothetical protein